MLRTATSRSTGSVAVSGQVFQVQQILRLPLAYARSAQDDGLRFRFGLTLSRHAARNVVESQYLARCSKFSRSCDSRSLTLAPRRMTGVGGDDSRHRFRFGLRRLGIFGGRRGLVLRDYCDVVGPITVMLRGTLVESQYLATFRFGLILRLRDSRMTDRGR